jgi:nicotinamidase-related amidase
MTHTALLIMDVQNGVVGRFGDENGYLHRLAAAADAARRNGVKVIYVVVGFRPGYPEISPRNKNFSALAGTGRFVDSDPATAIHPDVAPADGDVIAVKHRVSAFAGSDLDMVLRSAGIDSLVLAGIATSGVVLSTLRQAADLDYQLTVLADGCLDADPEVHRVLTEKIFPRQAEVVSTAEWIASTEGQRG